MEVLAVTISVGAAIVASTWRLASILADVRSDVRDLSRRLARVERACGIIDRDDSEPPRVTVLAEQP